MDFDVTKDLSDSELQSFIQMKQNIEELHGPEEIRDEPRLLRFLIARDFDVDKATSMLNNSIIWRRKYGIDDILCTYDIPEIFDKYLPITFIGFSKFGDLVVFVDFGIDLIGFSKSCTKSEFITYVMYSMETYCQKLEKKSQEEKKLCQTWIFVFDFEKTSLSQVTNKNGMDLLMSLLPIYEANYPERLKNGYIVNSSRAFTIAWAILSPFLYEKTRNKIKIFGKSDWMEELSELIDPDVLPACLGGRRTDPDGNPACLKLLKKARNIPQSYYSKKKPKTSLSSKTGVKRYNVPRRSRVTIRADVTEPNSKIEWEFQTENHDIGFGLSYSPVDGVDDEEDVIPVQKMDTRIFCEIGTYLCERPGTYTIVFDNSFSWLRSKELYVRADIVEPDGQKICVTS